MGINLIDKIVPKDSAFIGLVDYNQVIGLDSQILNIAGRKHEWKGNYTASTSYNIGDIVYYSGSSYICVLGTNGGQTPENQSPTSTTYWNILAQVGATGPAGAQGVQGIQGVEGPNGPIDNLTDVKITNAAHNHILRYKSGFSADPDNNQWLNSPSLTTLESTVSTHMSNTSNPHSVTASHVGLGNVINESKGTMFTSPVFTGVPTAPTATAGTNTTQLATTAYTDTAIANLVASAPTTLNTLNELALALGNDANFSTTITNSLSNKQGLDATLTALSNFNTNGILTQTALDTFTGRTITAENNKITVTNGNGVSGNPTIGIIESNLTLSNIGGSVTDAQVPNTITLDNITQITNRSHSNLTNIGTNTHAQIDTHISASNPHPGSAAKGNNTDISSIYLDNTGLKIKDNDSTTPTVSGLTIKVGSNLTADRIFTLTTGDTNRTLTLSGDTNISGTNTGDETTETIKTKLGAVDADSDGYLTFGDWNIFNAKQNALTFIPENKANKVSVFQTTPDNINYPTEKLVKDSLDLKSNLSHTHVLTPSDIPIATADTIGGIKVGSNLSIANGVLSGSAGTTALSGLITDVQITGTPTTGQMLRYEGTKWVNVDNLTIKLPTDNIYGVTESISGIANGDKIEDAFDKIEVIFSKLAPAKPANLSTKTLAISGLYSAILTNSGAMYNNVTDNTTPTATISDNSGFYDGDSGTLTALLDTIASGVRVLSTLPDAITTNGILTITEDKDPYLGQAGKEGFWKQLKVSITSTTPLSIGQHSYGLTHSISGTANPVFFYIDNPTTPSITSVSNGAMTYTRYISGIKSMAANTSVSITITSNNAIGTFYRTSQVHSVQSSYINSTANYSPTIASPSNTSVLSVALKNSVYTENITFNCYAYNSKGVSSSNSIINTNKRIDTVSNESERLTSGTGLNSASFGSTYDSTASLVTLTNELHLKNNLYKWPQGDYTSFDNSPNYNTITTGDNIDGVHYRWATFNVGTKSTPVNNLTINIPNAVIGTAYTDIKMFVKIGASGWLNATIDSNVSSPFNYPDTALSQSESTLTSRKITFGQTARSGAVYVRIGIKSTNTTYQFSKPTMV